MSKRRPKKFRRKPEIVEAVQWFPGVEIDGVTIDQKLSGYAYEGPDDTAGRPMYHHTAWITESRPRREVARGDWVIRNRHGELFVMDTRTFKTLYEPAEV